jgi:hypothetical protein
MSGPLPGTDCFSVKELNCDYCELCDRARKDCVLVAEFDWHWRILFLSGAGHSDSQSSSLQSQRHGSRLVREFCGQLRTM